MLATILGPNSNCASASQINYLITFTCFYMNIFHMFHWNLHHNLDFFIFPFFSESANIHYKLLYWWGGLNYEIYFELDICFCCQRSFNHHNKARTPKGQLISEWIYKVIASPKIRTKNCQDFCHHYTGQKSWQFCVHILEETMTS